MSKIKVMSTILANKIAAGEVVERVSSVVKELVENSIDAGSTNIKIDLLDAGKKQIRVTDDGIGMDEVDSEACFKRHATSKIYKDDDLFFINTLGFRGEALPSIASVSDVLLETYDGRVSTKIHIKGGEIIDKGLAPARKGTIITVSNLFYNTPARLKYLKSEPTELSHVSSFIEKLSLSYPKISFVLTNNNMIIIRTTGSGNLIKTIHEIYGASVSTNMLEIHASNDDYDISGYISKPIIQRSTKNFINTIVNGRIIKNYELNKIINDAYHTYKPEGSYPIVVINIDTDPTLIDVNIHPTKLDIKFSKMDALKNILTEAIKNALYANILVPNVEVSSKLEQTSERDNNEKIDEDEILISKLPSTLFVREDTIKYTNADTSNKEEENKQEKKWIKAAVQEEFEFKKPIKNEEMKKLELYSVGLVLGTYIVAENTEGMFLIDQHAAVERINYEDVLKGLIKKNTTKLLVPITLEFSSSEMSILKEVGELIFNMGFEFEEFGINTIKVTTHPTWVKEGFEAETIRTVFDEAIANKNFDPIKFNDHLAATIACKKSLKGNTRITNDLAKIILENLCLCDNPYNCPHGRPTIIKFTIYELEKMFKRAM